MIKRPFLLIVSTITWFCATAQSPPTEPVAQLDCDSLFPIYPKSELNELERKVLFDQSPGEENFRWYNCPRTSLTITQADLVRGGNFESAAFRSVLQKRLWLFECLVTGKIVEETFLFDTVEKRVILDLTPDGNGYVANGDRKIVEELLSVYQTSFSINNPSGVSPISNTRYRWIRSL